MLALYGVSCYWLRVFIGCCCAIARLLRLPWANLLRRIHALSNL